MNERRCDPIAVARGVHERFGIRCAAEIRIDLIAYHLGAIVLWREAGSADARVVRAGDYAYIAVAEEARGTPRARFSIAHELAHILLHADVDGIERIHGMPLTQGHEFRAEWEANRFASEVLVPTALAAPMCVAARPTLEVVGALAREFDVSLSVASQRWAEMTTGGCAFVESRGGVIKRAVRSAGFRGVAVGRRALEEGTLALEMVRTGAAPGTRVHATAWGAEKARRPIVEESVPLDDGGRAVLTWLWHE